ncbi:MAG: regulatory iron-sulfur-containing complex subunit RicT [Gemmatimonadales bacterium]
MTAVVEVRFKGNRREFYTWERGDELKPGDPVVVPTDRGEDLGHVSAVGDSAQRKCGIGCDGCPAGEVIEPKGAILRAASTEDAYLSDQLRLAEEDVRRKVLERVRAHNLQMKVSDAEWQWDRKKLTVYFTADKRVDFRSLVRDLASLFRTRIELRQIGARDESKRLGGVGRCGREFCCSAWLTELRPVSLSLAKDQQLSLNPTQISGGCGRLLCCLRYEHEFYVGARKRFPKIGRKVKTSVGLEVVEAVDIFRDRLLLKSEEQEVRTLSLQELKREVRRGEAKAPPPRKKDRGAPKEPQKADPSVTTEEAVSAVSPRKRKRKRRRRKRRKSGEPRRGKHDDPDTGEGTP